MSGRIERRAVEFRQSAPGVVEGIVIPYGVPSLIGGVFSETFRPGSLSLPDGLIANRQHDRSRPLARAGHGLTLDDTATALRASLTLPDTQEGRDTRALVDSGVLRGFSAEFIAVQAEWPDATTRIIHEARLTALAVVDDPGHEGAIISEVRAALDQLKQPRRRRIWL